MSKSLVVGNYGMRNTGDDALMNVTAWGVRRFLHADVCLTSTQPVTLHSGIKVPAMIFEKQAFPGQNRMKHYLAAMESDNVIFSGGFGFSKAKDINLKRQLMSLSGGCHHMALGIGLDTFEDSSAEKACARFLAECQFVGVRDQASFEIAKAIAPNANIELSFDLSPLMLQADHFELVNVERRAIAVCISPRERLNGQPELESKRLKKLASALDLIHRLTGEVIHFVDFNGHAELGDRKVHSELASYLSDTTRYQLVEYDANPFRVLQRMASYKALISMRLHASVFGFLTETPVLSLNASSKCEQWCAQTGMSNSHIFDANEFDPGILVNVARNGLEKAFEPDRLTVKMAVQAAMRNWRPCYEYAEHSAVFSCHTSV